MQNAWGGKKFLKIQFGKPVGKRPRRGWEDNMKLDLKYIVCEGVNFINLLQKTVKLRTLVNKVLNFRVT
jgi:hypothetical protein